MFPAERIGMATAEPSEEARLGPRSSILYRPLEERSQVRAEAL
jgi:hypothetical protein